MASAARARGRVTTPAPKPEIRLSEIQEWNKCRYRHHLRYRRGIERRLFHGPMDLGTVVHAGIAGAIRYYGHQQIRTKAIFRRSDKALVESCQKSIDEMVLTRWGNVAKAPEEEIRLADEITENGISIARRTIGMLRLERWLTYWYNGEPLVEQKLYWEEDEFIYTCIPDWVAEDLDGGGVWVLDYKIRKQYHPLDAEEVNVQFPAYQYVLARLGLATTGSVMVQVKARVPAVPKLNMNGAMSRAKIATTWDLYKEELIKNGLDPADYEGDMKAKLTTEFDRIQFHHRNDFLVNAFWEEIVVPAAREKLANPDSCHRHMHHMNCQGCWARAFCLGELMGEDTEFLLQSDYVDTNDPAPRVVLRPEDFELVED